MLSLLENFEAPESIGRPRTPLSFRKDRLFRDEKTGDMPLIIMETPKFIGKGLLNINIFWKHCRLIKEVKHYYADY